MTDGGIHSLLTWEVSSIDHSRPSLQVNMQRIVSRNTPTVELTFFYCVGTCQEACQY